MCPRREKYKPKHELTKYLPKEFQQIADSATDHIGSILDNTNSNEAIELGIMLGLGYLSWNTFSKDQPNMTLEKHVANTLYGPLAYKLATTSGGGGLITSQQIGLTMLALLGVIKISTDLLDAATKDIKKQMTDRGLDQSEADLLIKVYRATQGDYHLTPDELQAWEDYKKKYNK